MLSPRRARSSIVIPAQAGIQCFAFFLLLLAADNPFCESSGFSLRPDSPAIDAGEFIPGFHCPAPDPGDGNCVEWYGKAPDIGACEFIPASTQPPPAAPSNATVREGGQA